MAAMVHRHLVDLSLPIVCLRSTSLMVVAPEEKAVAPSIVVFTFIYSFTKNQQNFGYGKINRTAIYRNLKSKRKYHTLPFPRFGSTPIIRDGSGWLRSLRSSNSPRRCFAHVEGD
nr:hypothetical protein Itr_chr15CG16560 [Ipomoea trifida]GMD52367.1 hypothetical protein Iba_scaffold47250CG0020 [Ipomoea batatas]